MSNTSARYNSNPQSIYPHGVRDLLDDISLIASGSGGAYHVTAACLELADQEQRTIIIRMARDAGMNDKVLDEIKEMLQEIVRSRSEG